MKLDGNITYTAKGNGDELAELRAALDLINDPENWEVDATLTGNIDARPVNLADGDDDSPELDTNDDANDAKDDANDAKDSNEDANEDDPDFSDLVDRRLRCAIVLAENFPRMMTPVEVAEAAYLPVDSDGRTRTDVYGLFSTALGEMARDFGFAERIRPGRTYYYTLTTETLRHVRDAENLDVRTEPDHGRYGHVPENPNREDVTPSDDDVMGWEQANERARRKLREDQ